MDGWMEWRDVDSWMGKQTDGIFCSCLAKIKAVLGWTFSADRPGVLPAWFWPQPSFFGRAPSPWWEAVLVAEGQPGVSPCCCFALAFWEALRGT